MIDYTQIILVIIGETLAFSAGIVIGKSLSNPHAISMEQFEEIYREASKPDIIPEDEEYAPSHTPGEDMVSSEGVGIVYRPTVDEINKMNEPQQVKEAKEAIAETLRQERPPELL